MTHPQAREVWKRIKQVFRWQQGYDVQMPLDRFFGYTVTIYDQRVQSFGTILAGSESEIDWTIKRMKGERE